MSSSVNIHAVSFMHLSFFSIQSQLSVPGVPGGLQGGRKMSAMSVMTEASNEDAGEDNMLADVEGESKESSGKVSGHYLSQQLLQYVFHFIVNVFFCGNVTEVCYCENRSICF